VRENSDIVSRGMCQNMHMCVLFCVVQILFLRNQMKLENKQITYYEKSITAMNLGNYFIFKLSLIFTFFINIDIHKHVKTSRLVLSQIVCETY